MEDFISLAKSRCSVRKFSDRSVDDDTLARILEAGRVAPTACNNQPWRVLALRSPDSLEKLGKACRFFGAPLALIVCGDNNETWVRSFDSKDTLEIDATIVTDHLMLEAESLGLSSCWICHFNPSALRVEFGIPGHLTPVNILAIGYAAGPKKSPDRYDAERRPVSELVAYERF